MAVPKKRKSKAKKNARKANWKRKGFRVTQKSFSLSKSIFRSMLPGKSTSFIYDIEYTYTINQDEGNNKS